MQAGALTGSVALPFWVPAATESPSTLNALPRVALVIGNTDYPEAPLRNSANDAKAIGIELQKFGFKVNLQLNADRVQMANAIKRFGGDLASNKGVGLFYYAGHGAQLAWRNYLIPVDATIDKLDDMRDKTVELNTLLQGLVGARNAMNLIILDACRDNPFGNKVLTEQRGLSQFDAPPGSLLAYATSPGNTAADGEGENGLYTENLLHELTVPEAKIEDVFKRVRLAVRRKSQGRQIPWESTSLEDDFYFIPPKQIRKPSKEELDQQFDAELQVWEKAISAKEPIALEDFLRRFPSGNFSELAQFRLERLLAKLEKPTTVASLAPSPAVLEAERKQQEELARAEAELKKQQELAKTEVERKRQEEIARAEAERKRQEALAKAEAERKRLEELAVAETERRKKEDLVKAEEERKQRGELARAEVALKKQQALAKAETDRKQQEELARAEAELKKQQELAKTEVERKRQEEIARAEAERKRQEALAKAEAERKRLEELIAAETERRKKEDLVKAEEERKQREKLARAEVALKKQQELARAEAAKVNRPAVVVFASIAPNPFSKGTAMADVDYKIGDSYTYRVLDTLTKLETGRLTRRVTAITEENILFNDGKVITDLIGNELTAGDTIQQFFPSEYAVGKKWKTRYGFIHTGQGGGGRRHSRAGQQDFMVMEMRIVTREMITVPAGTFNAFRIEGRGFGEDAGDYETLVIWMSPDVVRGLLAREIIRRRNGGYRQASRNELVDYHQA